jgi:hypothetical protein
MTTSKTKIRRAEERKIEEICLEQYQCQKCGRFFYIDKKDKSDLDFNSYGCAYGCFHGSTEEEIPHHTRTLSIKIEKVVMGE